MKVDNAQMDQKSRSTVYRTNAALREALRHALMRDGVTPRKKSQWICDAIVRLFNEDPNLHSVGAGEDLETYPYSDAVVLNEVADAVIDKAYGIIRAVDPRAEGIAASVIRAAIRWSAAKIARIA